MKYSVYYSGGSGGYMFYQGLNMLLGIYTNQIWPKNDFKNWKDYEVKINNSQIKLHCNVDYIVDELPSILLYTDKHLQYELAYLKKANWFHKSNVSKHLGILLYNNVKDISWPDINNISEFESLSKVILNELYKNFGLPKNPSSEKTWIDYKKSRHRTMPGTDIIRELKNLYNTVDYKFLLQDVILTKFKCVSDTLNLTHTREVEDHVDMWVKLHPKHIQEMLQK